MKVFKKVAGTQETTFGVGLDGPILKENGVDELQVRNNADSAFAKLKVAAPVDDNDAATKKYVDTAEKPMIMADQVDTSTSLPDNTGSRRLLVVTTAGNGAVIGDLLFDDGSGSNPMEILGIVNGRTISILVALSGGTVTFDPDSLYSWDNDASSGSTKWVKIADVGGVTGGARVIRYTLDNSADQDSVTSIPANAIILDTKLTITTSYSAGADISIGRTGSLSLLQAIGDNNPQGATDDEFSVEGTIDFGGSALPVKTTITGTPAAGAGFVTVIYSAPDA